MFLLQIYGKTDEQLKRLEELFKMNGWPLITNMKKFFFFDVDKYAEEKVEEFYEEFRNSAEAWERQMKKALSKKIPPQYLKSRKATRLGRKFPYTREGYLKNSVVADVWAPTHSTSGRSWKVEGDFEISQGQSRLTSEGLPTRSDGKTGTWKGWLDDMFSGEGRGRFYSAKQMFEDMIGTRQRYKPI